MFICLFIYLLVFLASYSSKENDEKKDTPFSEKDTTVTSDTNGDQQSLVPTRKLSSQLSKIFGKDDSSSQQVVEMMKSGIFSKISIHTIKGIMELICDESVSWIRSLNISFRFLILFLSNGLWKKKDFNEIICVMMIQVHTYNTSLNKSQAWHIDGTTNKKIHMIFIKY